MKQQRTRPEGCLSDYAFDRRLASELQGDELAHAESHIAECTRCSARASALQDERDAFAAGAPALRLPEAPASVASIAGRQRRGMLAGRALSALALAAAVVLFLVFRGPGRDGASSTRTKGGEASLGFYVNHRGSVRLGGPQERVAPGDGLRFTVRGGEGRYLSILSVDGARRASIYHPATGDEAQRLAGASAALPQSTTLDDTLGDETLYGVFCDAPYAAEPLRRALEAHPDAPPRRDGCVVDTLHIRKEADAPP